MLNQIINIRTSQEKKEKFRQIVEQDGQKISHVFQSFMSQVIKSGKLPKNLLKEGK
jgi:addiction module RelB/DinJ family antitoxin